VGDPNKGKSNFFAGDIAQVCLFDKTLSGGEIKEYYKVDYPNPLHTKLYYDFSNVKDDIVYDLSGNGNHGIINGGYVETETIGRIPNTTLPYRTRPGRFFSQEHKRNDMVGGKWVHQKDTSVNEKRFVEEVQGGIINTDEDGLTDLKYDITRRYKLFGTKHEIIDFGCGQDIPSHVEL
jgi:hypothetical protein